MGALLAQLALGDEAGEGGGFSPHETAASRARMTGNLRIKLDDPLLDLCGFQLVKAGKRLPVLFQNFKRERRLKLLNCTRL
jgi:hypothetical protein